MLIQSSAKVVFSIGMRMKNQTVMSKAARTAPAIRSCAKKVRLDFMSLRFPFRCGPPGLRTLRPAAFQPNLDCPAGPLQTLRGDFIQRVAGGVPIRIIEIDDIDRRDAKIAERNMVVQHGEFLIRYEYSMETQLGGGRPYFRAQRRIGIPFEEELLIGIPDHIQKDHALAHLPRTGGLRRHAV